MRATRLTARQRQAFDALADIPAPGLSPDALGARIGTNRYGAAETASILVRRGMVGRFYTSDGRVHYHRVEATS